MGFSGSEIEGEVGRRGFLNAVLFGGVTALFAATVYPIVKYVLPRQSRDVSVTTVIAAKVGELVPNSGKIFRFGDRPAILLDTPKGDLRAFTAVCTHLGCTVQYRKDLEHIWCACHNGHYDLNGRVISGPPPRPLERYEVAVKGGEIFVSKA